VGWSRGWQLQHPHLEHQQHQCCLLHQCSLRPSHCTTQLFSRPMLKVRPSRVLWRILYQELSGRQGWCHGLMWDLQGSLLQMQHHPAQQDNCCQVPGIDSHSGWLSTALLRWRPRPNSTKQCLQQQQREEEGMWQLQHLLLVLQLELLDTGGTAPVPSLSGSAPGHCCKPWCLVLSCTSTAHGPAFWPYWLGLWSCTCHPYGPQCVSSSGL